MIQKGNYCFSEQIDKKETEKSEGKKEEDPKQIVENYENISSQSAEDFKASQFNQESILPPSDPSSSE